MLLKERRVDNEWEHTIGWAYTLYVIACELVFYNIVCMQAKART